MTTATTVTTDRMGVVLEKTNIDRRGAQRQVPMKVLGLGLGRTGTASTRAALMQLGFIGTYHMAVALGENVKDADLWREAFVRKFETNGPPLTREFWDALLGDFMATMDWPGAAFADELIAAYPDAKVLLTVRDSPEVWHKSAMDTVYASKPIFGPTASFGHRLIQYLMPEAPRKVLGMIFKHHILTDDFPVTGPQSYVEHNDYIRKITPKGQFLEFNVKQGWEPLCEFLGVPVPDMPFPRVNDSSTFNETVTNAQKQMVFKLLRNVVVGASTVGVAIAAWLHTSGKAPWL